VYLRIANGIPEEPRDLMDVLIHQLGENPEDIVAINRICLEALMVGTDTAAASVEWFLLMISAYPLVQQKIYDEIQTLGEAPGLHNHHRLTYLHNVLREVLRYSSVGVTSVRMCTQTTTICGYTIPKGAIVQGNLFYLAHDPKLWKDPENFRPERFEEAGNTGLSITASHGDAEIENYKFSPFGFGRRICVAQYLITDYLLPIVCSKLVNDYVWEHPAKNPVSHIKENETFIGIYRVQDQTLLVSKRER